MSYNTSYVFNVSRICEHHNSHDTMTPKRTLQKFNLNKDVIKAIDSKIDSITYEFTHDSALKSLGLKDVILALEDEKRMAPAATPVVEGVCQEPHPTPCFLKVPARCQLSYLFLYAELVWSDR